MNDCTSCALADWQRTAAGRLHPSGDGRCTWDGWKKWRLPPSMAIPGIHNPHPPPLGGYISRRKPHSAKDCPYFQPITSHSSSKP